MRHDRGDEPPPEEVSEDTAEETVVDDEWPVPPEYKERGPAAPTVASPEAVPPPPAETAGPESPLVVSDPAEAAAPPARRWPPSVVPGLLGLALVLLVGGIILAFALTDDGDDEASAGDTTSVTTAPTDTTETTDMTGTTTTDTGTTPTPARVTVPDVAGMSLDEARRALARERLRVRVRRAESDRPAGEVVSQQPEAEREVEPRSTVVLVVSSGPAQVAVPDVVGRTRSEAVRALREADLEASVSTRSSSERAGTVLEQAPSAGTRADPGSTVRLVVAKEPEPTLVRVPRLVGLPVADARSRLRQAGLRSTVTRVESSREEGTVVRQRPGAGASLREGGVVELEVSSGPARISVPDVVGQDEASARQAITSAGLVVEVVDQPTDDPAQDGIVLSQTPRAGASAERGAVVTITVARLA